MNALVCELCGSHDVIKQDGYFVCQQCGTKYTVEEAKKIIGADKSDEAVKIDRSSETEKLLVLARRARDENNDENAAKYYDMVLRDDTCSSTGLFFLRPLDGERSTSISESFGEDAEGYAGHARGRV